MNQQSDDASIFGEIIGRFVGISLISLIYATIFHTAFSEFTLLQSFVICYVFTFITFKL